MSVEDTQPLITHLISDVENILDEVIFIQEGQLKLHASVERCV